MPARILMIGLDAAEPELVERWTGDGSLPTLRALRERGSFGRLASTAEWLVGSPWPAFYTGMPPSETGLYHSIVWRPDRLDHVRPSAAELELVPFWRRFGDQDPRVLAFDVPLTQRAGTFNGVEINGWANTDLLDPPFASPPDALARLVARHGSPHRAVENYRLESVDALLALRDEQIGVTQAIGGAAAQLLRDEAWDLALVSIHTAHYSGHKLWDDRNVAGEVPASRRDELAGALRAVYAACDAAVARLIEAAAPSVVLVFSLHGMGPNTCRTDLLGEMLRGVLAGSRRPPRGAVDRLAHLARGVLPAELRFAVKRRLPQALSDRLTVFWRTGTRDWASTRAFNVFSDLRGYVRVNQRGRERHGIVAEGAERDALLDEIVAGIASFCDADTGEPVLAASRRIETLYPTGRKRDRLPDLILRWSDVPAARHRALTSDRFGTIDWPTPGRLFSGRSGNHRGDGFLIADGLGRRAPRADMHILGLMPTVCDLLGVPSPLGATGRSLRPRAPHSAMQSLSAS